jgi:hypothetical protein
VPRSSRFGFCVCTGAGAFDCKKTPTLRHEIVANVPKEEQPASSVAKAVAMHAPARPMPTRFNVLRL